MQHIIFRIVCIVVFITGSVLAKAQNKDSVIIMKVERDSFKNYKVYPQKIKKDTVNRKYARQYCDTAFRKKNFVRLDSMNRIFLKRKSIQLDSLKRMKVNLKYRDSTFRKMNAYARLDSIHTKMKVNLKYRDSGYRKMMAYQKMDSLQLQLHLQNIKMDSVKLKLHLQNLKLHLQHLKADSVMRANMKVREITMEIPFDKNSSTVYIDNIRRKATIKTISGNKVKVQATVYYEGEMKLTDAELFQKLNLQLKQNEDGIVIQASEKEMTRIGVSRTTMSGNLFTPPGDAPRIKDNKKIEIVIYMPANAKLNIESNYSDVAIENNIKYINARMNNADLTMLNADKAVIVSRYAAVRVGNIKDADLDLSNCTLVSKDIDHLKIISRNSKASFDNANTMVLQSTSDQYHITQVSAMEGNKNFGKMSITNLKNNMTLTGSNADLKIDNIDLKADLVKIDNKYADVQLPVYNLKAYTVNFSGKNSKVFTAFEKMPLADSMNNNFRMNFSAIVGDVSSSHTKFQINCNSCNVDFKN
jgi:hypothetical protein